MRKRNRQYAGSDWIESSFKVELSPLGAKVADFLGDVFLGIYHLNTTSLRKAEWDNPDYIEVTIDRALSTFDGNDLTKIVVLAHHQLLRVSIKGLGPRYLRLAFHQRTSRDGHLYKRCPHLSDHVRAIERHHQILPERPRTVCLCGSTRFSEAYQQANLEETLAGRIVLTIGCDMRSDGDLFTAKTDQERDEIKARLDELHLRKIDLADEILVLNVGGYIGDSTRREIEYAQSRGKVIRYLEDVASKEPA